MADGKLEEGMPKLEAEMEREIQQVMRPLSHRVSYKFDLAAEAWPLWSRRVQAHLMIYGIWDVLSKTSKSGGNSALSLRLYSFLADNVGLQGGRDILALVPVGDGVAAWAAVKDFAMRAGRSEVVARDLLIARWEDLQLEPGETPVLFGQRMRALMGKLVSVGLRWMRCWFWRKRHP